MDELMNEEVKTAAVDSFADYILEDRLQDHWLECPDERTAESAASQIIRKLSLQEAGKRLIVDLTATQLQKILTEEKYTLLRGIPHLSSLLLAAAVIDHTQELNLTDEQVHILIKQISSPPFMSSIANEYLLKVLSRGKHRGDDAETIGITSDLVTTLEVAQKAGLRTSTYPRTLARTIPEGGVKMVVVTRPIEEVEDFIYEDRDLTTSNGFDNDVNPLQRKSLSRFIK